MVLGYFVALLNLFHLLPWSLLQLVVYIYTIIDAFGCYARDIAGTAVVRVLYRKLSSHAEIDVPARNHFLKSIKFIAVCTLFLAL